jgi:hypothetical protein
VLELDQPLLTLGRDPGSDVVLSDSKCSRRHAVIEQDADGFNVRDTGSANGIYLNNRRVERARLRPGDLLRLGEIVIKVLPEDDVAGTVVVVSDDLEEPSPAAGRARSLTTTEVDVPAAPLPVEPRPRAAVAGRAGPPPTRRAAPAEARAPEIAARQGRESSGPLPRPFTVGLLAALWLATSLLALAGGVFAVNRAAGATAYVGLAAGLLLAGLGSALAVGLWMRAGWARVLQIGLAGVGLLVCPFTPAAATVLFYLLRPEARLHFSTRRSGRGLTLDEAGAVSASSDTVFGLSLLAMTALGVLLSAGAWLAWKALSTGE